MDKTSHIQCISRATELCHEGS